MSAGGGFLEAVGIALIAGAAIFGSYYVAWRALTGMRWRRPARLPTDPIPQAWREIVERGIPIASRLTVPEQEKLVRLVQVFLRDKHIEGCAGLEITEEMKVTIAAHACVLLLNLDAGCYPGLRTVLVYPDTYQPRSPAWFKYDLGSTEARLGESWRQGVVVLSWSAVAASAANQVDGQNVTLHEFAHQLDQEDGVADGIPVLKAPSAYRNWAAVIGRHYDDLVADAERGRRSVLDHYGAKNRAEFFAVATETFFEQPLQLLEKHPELYDELRRFYGQDPAERLRVPPV